MTRVLPEPAPASTRIGPPPWPAASRCGGLSFPRSITANGVRYGSVIRSSIDADYDRLVADLRREFPRLRIIRKHESRMHRAIHHFLVAITFGGMRKYLDGYQTTIGSTIYVTRDWDDRPAEIRYVTLRHEAIHLRQFRKYTLPGWRSSTSSYRSPWASLVSGLFREGGVRGEHPCRGRRYGRTTPACDYRRTSRDSWPSTDGCGRSGPVSNAGTTVFWPH